MRQSILSILFLFTFMHICAQQECAFILEETQDMFEAGLIENIPDKLSDCMEKGFNREDKLQAYKLIILSLLFDDNVNEADAYMLRFLNEYPDYEPVATDPREFVVLMETYDTDPVLMLGGGAGPDFSFPLMLEPYGTHNVDILKGNYVPGGAGFHVFFQLEKQLAEGLVIKGGFAFTNNVYEHYLAGETDMEISTGEITDFSRIDYYETQSRLHLPIAVAYNFLERDFQPYLFLGISPAILISAIGEATRTYTFSGEIRYDPINVSGVSMNKNRRFFNAWASAGLGARYDVGPGDFFFQAEYHFNLMDQVRTGSDRYMSNDLVFGAYYVEDDFLLNRISVSAGYLLPLYKPKKKEM